MTISDQQGDFKSWSIYFVNEGDKVCQFYCSETCWRCSDFRLMQLVNLIMVMWNKDPEYLQTSVRHQASPSSQGAQDSMMPSLADLRMDSGKGMECLTMAP